MLKCIQDYINRVKSSSTFLKMAESLPVSLGLKRPAETDNVDSSTDKRKKKKKHQVVQLSQSEGFKRKIAMLVAYNGAGYYGVQINPGFQTIESEIFPALVKIGAVPQDHADTPSKMWFQRGSRTDKGVSAVVIVPDLVNKMNEVLPAQIRVIGYVRTTNGFDSKNWCDSRTYTYMTPTYAFAPITKFVTEEYRTDSDIITRLRAVLNKFVGTHNFHNFTSGVKFEQACAKRYIIKFECSEPYVREGLEFVTIQVQGQSFMLHHIRKMIGLTIAILRGYCGESAIEASWGPEKVDIPKAPGLGLILEALHVNGYNKRFGSDGIHEPIDWSPYKETVEKFREEHIISHIVSQEKTDRVMFNWLRTLQFHNFDQPKPDGQRPWRYVITELQQYQSPGQKEGQSLDVQPDGNTKPDNAVSSSGEPSSLAERSTSQHDQPLSAENSAVPVMTITINCEQPTYMETVNDSCQQQPFAETPTNENLQQQPLVVTPTNENCQQQPLVVTPTNENCQQQPLVVTPTNENCQQQPFVETPTDGNCQQQASVETLANENCQQQAV